MRVIPFVRCEPVENQRKQTLQHRRLSINTVFERLHVWQEQLKMFSSCQQAINNAGNKG